MWANVSRWTLSAERIVDEQLVQDALTDASQVVARQSGFVRFEAIRTAPDALVIVSVWASSAAAKRAATLTPVIRDFYANYVLSAELVSGEIIVSRDAGPSTAGPG